MSGSVTRLTWNLSNDLQQLFGFHFMVNAFRAGWWPSSPGRSDGSW